MAVSVRDEHAAGLAVWHDDVPAGTVNAPDGRGNEQGGADVHYRRGPPSVETLPATEMMARQKSVPRAGKLSAAAFARLRNRGDLRCLRAGLGWDLASRVTVEEAAARLGLASALALAEAQVIPSSRAVRRNSRSERRKLQHSMSTGNGFTRGANS